MAILSDLKSTLTALVPELKKQGGIELEARAKVLNKGYVINNWSSKRKSLVTRLEDLGDSQPLNPNWLMMKITETLPDNSVVVNEALTSTRDLNALRPYKDRYDFHAFASGGIGWAVPAAVGIQLADMNRPVCAIIGDGSAMYSIQALWTAAHMKIPVTYIITNNSSYRILKQRLLSFHGNDSFIGMDLKDPPIDFTAIARGMGVTAIRITVAKDVVPALRTAFANPGPNLLDIAVDDHV
jgi:benzoylformate decarboxylase